MSELILASRSPQRRNLIEHVAGQRAIRIVPPINPDELGFDGLSTTASITERLTAIAHDKLLDVGNQLKHDELPTGSLIVAADTVIVTCNDQGQRAVLGQPPSHAQWKATVREWFLNQLLGRTHWAMSCVCVSNGCPTAPATDTIRRVVTTEVDFRPAENELLEWYLATEEPLGKAGGYAIQGAGSVFVSQIRGSLSNVIGLPLEAMREMLNEF